jgi:hypothetical protein
MVDILTKILTPAISRDLITLDELKLALGISDASQDATLGRYITVYSDMIATLCNRTFAKETLTETWRDLDSNHLFLSHYPIATETDIASVGCPRGITLDPSTYEIDLKDGQISLFATQSEPITVSYTGGYNLPDDAPPALSEALVVMVREARAAAQRASVSGIRSMSHKESRVVYFDPNLLASRGFASNVLNPGIAPLVDTLLMHYVRIQV